MVDVLVIGGGNAALCAALMAREAGAVGAAARSRAARMARRQFAAHAQPALHARRAAGRAGRRLSGRGVLAGPAQGHGRPHRRKARAARDPRVVDAAATGCAGTACTSSRRCPARCTSRAPTRSSWAAARRSSTPTTAAPSGWASQVRYDAPVDALELATAASSPRASATERIEARACVLAAGGFESNREWLREAWGQNDAANGRPTTS